MIRNRLLVGLASVLLVLCGASRASAVLNCTECGVCEFACSYPCQTDTSSSTCGAFTDYCTPSSLCTSCLSVGELASLQLEPKPATPADPVRGRVAARLTWRLAEYAEQNGLGDVYTAETGSLPGIHVQAPDLAFVQHEHLGTASSPDLAVEIRSRLEPAAVTAAKARAWLAAGVHTVLLIDPATETIAVHRNRSGIKLLRADDLLEIPALLPGWSVRVGDLFEK